ncbi:MAG TPA: DEAD/DEAH box helicase [Armatimonadetes bacterium]|nr:DEAD/DEAH box helicase [Armatimonadota bacterium]
MGRRAHQKRRKGGGARYRLRELVERFLRGMGEPEPEEFKPSPFQEEALELVMRGEDVIVVAPTGSGKTWIAEQAMGWFFGEGKRCWYTTPLKALSNQKFDNFCELYGPQNVGIITGERRENTSAPVIVATTEILRNQFYSGLEPPDFVVLDEAHYIADPERGVTWEEVIILAPRKVQFLLLSATISNPEDIIGWMGETRGKEPKLVTCEERPVPLRYGILIRNGKPIPLDEKLPASIYRQALRKGLDPVEVVEALEEHNLLPAIIFLPRRRDCDEAARQFAGVVAKGRPEREKAFEGMASQFPSLLSHPMRPILVSAGVAPHHAGHLTAWKVAVERMLRKGLLRAVFATTTLAAGLDVPARTVVLPHLTVRDGRGERPLSALEFHQMTGRAGRRGKDKVGFVLIVPRRERDIRIARQLMRTEPEELRSAFRVQYFQVLNLLAKYGREGALDILARSLLVYQRAQRSHRRARKVRHRLKAEFEMRAVVLRELGYLDEELRPTETGRWALLVRHEQALFIVEAVRRGLLDGLSPPRLAGWAAVFSGERAPQELVLEVDLSGLEEVVREIAKVEREAGLEPSPFLLEFEKDDRSSPAERRAAAVEAWAEGIEWLDLVERSRMEEGDIQRLLLQTAEVLRQIEDLPLPIAEEANKARRLLFRPPITEGTQ